LLLLIKGSIKHPWEEGIKIVQIKGQVLFKSDIITNMQKKSEVIEKSSFKESLSQKS
jgi:hypothetical protein